MLEEKNSSEEDEDFFNLNIVEEIDFENLKLLDDDDEIDDELLEMVDDENLYEKEHEAENLINEHGESYKW